VLAVAWGAIRAVLAGGRGRIRVIPSTTRAKTPLMVLIVFVYGKKQGRWPHLVAGMALAVYPYVATTVTMLVTIGLLIGAGLWFAVRVGW
jgi:hypothetical protein